MEAQGQAIMTRTTTAFSSSCRHRSKPQWDQFSWSQDLTLKLAWFPKAAVMLKGDQYAH